MAKQLGNFVESLVHQCYHYIAMNLEQFPVSCLSLLPLTVREELLWRLPIADLCMLEDTEYVEGFHDVASYWKLPCKDFRKVLLNHADVAHYICGGMGQYKVCQSNSLRAATYMTCV